MTDVKTEVKLALCTPDALCASPFQFFTQLTDSYEILCKRYAIRGHPDFEFLSVP